MEKEKIVLRLESELFDLLSLEKDVDSRYLLSHEVEIREYAEELYSVFFENSFYSDEDSVEEFCSLVVQTALKSKDSLFLKDKLGEVA